MRRRTRANYHCYGANAHMHGSRRSSLTAHYIVTSLDASDTPDLHDCPQDRRRLDPTARHRAHQPSHTHLALQTSIARTRSSKHNPRIRNIRCRPLGHTVGTQGFPRHPVKPVFSPNWEEEPKFPSRLDCSAEASRHYPQIGGQQPHRPSLSPASN